MKRLGQKLKEVANEVNLAQATASHLKESQAIKEEVVSKLNGIAQEKRTGDAYVQLVSIYDSISQVHDRIYARPRTGVNKQSAVTDCNTLLGQQRVFKATFDQAFNTFIAAQVPAVLAASAPAPSMQ